MLECIAFILKKDDIRNVLLKDQRKRALSFEYLKFYTIFLMLSFIAFGFFIFFKEDSFLLKKQVFLLLAGLFILFVSLTFIGYYIFSVPLYIYYALKKDKRIGKSHIIRWNANAISIDDSMIKGSYPFRLFYDWREEDEGFVLYIHKNRFNFIPKSTLNKEQILNLREILIKHVSHERN